MAKKKVALIFNGLLRLHTDSERTWRKFIDRYEADVFFHAWKTDTSMVDRMFHMYSPITYQIDSPIEMDVSPYADRLYPGLSTYNIFSMWTSIQRGFRMMRSHYVSMGYEPDLIVRSRTDLVVEDLFLDFDQPMVIPMEPMKEPACFYYGDQFLVPQADVLCYGKMPGMEKYCDTVDLIPTIFQQSDFIFTSENMLASSLYLQRVGFLNQTTKLRLAR
jgi:hypothetical protein